MGVPPSTAFTTASIVVARRRTHQTALAAIVTSELKRRSHATSSRASWLWLTLGVSDKVLPC